MPTIKIIDTCTLINIFNSLDFDLAPCLEEYRAVVTNHVVSEYTRKIPRQIPKCISVIGMSERGETIMEDLEFLFPRLGIGERSVLALALETASAGSKVVVITDDKDAVKKLSGMVKNKDTSAKFFGSENIIYGNTLSLIGKFVDDCKIPQSCLDRARRILKH